MEPSRGARHSVGSTPQPNFMLGCRTRRAGAREGLSGAPVIPLDSGLSLRALAASQGAGGSSVTGSLPRGSAQTRTEPPGDSDTGGRGTQQGFLESSSGDSKMLPKHGGHWLSPPAEGTQSLGTPKGGCTSRCPGAGPTCWAPIVSLFAPAPCRT